MDPKKLTWWWVKVKLMYSKVTIEPLFFLYALGVGFYAIAKGQLYIDKVCKVNFNISEEICNNLPKYEDQQNKVQAYVSELNAYNDVIQAIVPFILAIFAGPWSDIYGRKNLLMCSVFGYSLCNFVFFINTVYFYELKAEFLMFEAIQDCTGGSTMFYLAAYSYLTDISDPKTRTTRFAFMDGVFPIGFYVGNALAGPIKHKFGYLYNFGLGMLMTLLGFFYVAFFLPDSIPIRDQRLKRDAEDKIEELRLAKKFEEAEKVEVEEAARLSKTNELSMGAKNLFNLKNVKTCTQTLFKKRENHTRALMLLLILAYELDYFVLKGHWSTSYMFVRKTLKFTMTDYSRFITIAGIMGLLGQYVVLPYMSTKLLWKDSIIGMIECITNVINLLFYGHAVGEWMLYIGNIIGILTSTGTTVARSMLSKLVPGSEIGSVFTGVAILQALTPFASGPVFGMLYGSTVDYFPQAIIYLMVSIKAVMFLDLMAIYFTMKADEKTRKTNDKP